jgi:MFS family permease
MGNLMALYGGIIVIILIGIVIVYVIATPCLGGWLAETKGYSSTLWAWLCFFFGVLALIALAGAPDRSKIQKDEKIGKTQAVWKCQKCNTENPNNVFTCKSCGYKIVNT